jgi:hypothetical protein
VASEREPRIRGSRRMSPGTEDPRVKAGRSIRCGVRMRPLKRARTGFEPLKRTGASASCQRVLRTPVLETYISSVAPITRSMRSLSVGRVRTPFIQRRRKCSKKSSQKGGARAHRAGGQGFSSRAAATDSRAPATTAAFAGFPAGDTPSGNGRRNRSGPRPA